MKLSRECRRQEFNILKLVNKQLKMVTSYKYLGSLVTEQNSIPAEIEERVAAGNRAYPALQQQHTFKSTSVSSVRDEGHARRFLVSVSYTHLDVYKRQHRKRIARGRY